LEGSACTDTSEFEKYVTAKTYRGKKNTKSNLNKMALNAKARPRNLIMSKGKTLKQMYGLFDHGKQKNIILKDSMKKNHPSGPPDRHKFSSSCRAGPNLKRLISKSELPKPKPGAKEKKSWS
jgi:hypothetical protein